MVNIEKLPVTYTARGRFNPNQTASHQTLNKFKGFNSPAVNSGAKHSRDVHSKKDIETLGQVAKYNLVLLLLVCSNVKSRTATEHFRSMKELKIKE